MCLYASMYIWLVCILDIVVCLMVLTLFSQSVTKKKMEVRHSERMFKSHRVKPLCLSCNIQIHLNEST